MKAKHRHTDRYDRLTDTVRPYMRRRRCAHTCRGTVPFNLSDLSGMGVLLWKNTHLETDRLGANLSVNLSVVS